MARVVINQDHPRLRGEHLYSLVMSSSHQGSPPLTRGTHAIGGQIERYQRITPAYAGNTLLPYFLQYLCGDHPRLRGEHQYEKTRMHRILGSPPLTRGTRKASTFNVQNLRITPAYAGNTCK